MCSRFAVMLLLLIHNRCLLGQMCSSIDKFVNVHGILENTRINAEPFLISRSVGLIKCLRSCATYSLCKAFNFEDSSGTCELHREMVMEENIESFNGYLTSNLSSWLNKDINYCQNHMCGYNAICEPRLTNYICTVIGCFDSFEPFANKTTFTKMIYGFGDIVATPCQGDYYTNVTVQCSSAGTWTSFKCYPYQQIRNCNFLHKNCNPALLDGEYWLYPPSQNGVRTKVYCHNMQTTDPEAFITLHEHNFASKSIYVYDPECFKIMADDVTINANALGLTTFQKISFAPATGDVRNDYTFAITNDSVQTFGTAGDCVDESYSCSALGNFLINLSGTGLLVDPDVSWVEDSTSSEMNITNDDNRVISGVCGKGCSGCSPSPSIKLVPDPDYKPPMESATRPICTL
ncbi:uncharacterized protein LOC126819714 [Patella vulgata]|uniref:uncharacterized protein LOC126819714 n=1 Tax=Patella vulgata TaxID=6465 RepID=UPI00217FE1E1|nr:uncharacterized protein LOC126819714 [Patella vulgata]